MENKVFHHALKIRQDVCIGCSHCMRVCPTEALRVKNGKAELYENRCIDCGECFRVCPTCAIIIEQDDFSKIYNYQYRVALIPSILSGQFSDEITPGAVKSILQKLGFNDVIEVETSVAILKDEINRYLKTSGKAKPVISSFCPAIVRLIQVKFPSLVENLMLLKPPLDITSIYIKKKLVEKGIKEEQIGIFYITPCAAKIAAVKSPVGDDRSEVAGVINMNVIYNKVLKSLVQFTDAEKKLSINQECLSGNSLIWSLTNGEASQINGRCLAIDGVNNVMEFLEKLENDEISDIDFLELRACDESCAGGVLTTGNRFLTVERLHNRAKITLDNSTKTGDKRIGDYEDYLKTRVSIGQISPRSMMKLDEDMAKAMKKMERSNRLMCFLPGIDCGSCGAPSCQALAEDIVQGQAAISHCIFLQKTMEQSRKLHPDHSFRIMEKIWGKDRFEKNCNKIDDSKRYH
jgi:iron only hydrogenase large subunit-like protein